jgi:SAM-dependent methyltransferase
MDTATAYRAWDETWKTPEGRQKWLKPDPGVVACAARLRMEGAATALDLGCGVGRHALALASIGFETTAFDAAETGLAQVREEASRRGLDVHTVRGQMTDLPFPDGAFDYVLAHHVIYHGDRSVAEKAIAEIRRVLAPGGTFQGTMLSKRRADYAIGQEIAPDTFVQPGAPGDKAHPHFYCDAAGVVALFKDFEPRSLEDIGDDGSWHWHLVAERRD